MRGIHPSALCILVAVASCGSDDDDPCASLPHPMTLVDEEAALGMTDPLVNDLTVDREYVYWVDFFAGKVRRVSKSGTGAKTLSDGDTPVRVLVDDEYVYWINSRGGVRLIPKNGAAATEVSPDLLCDSGDCGRSLALDETTIYWLDDSRMMARAKAPGDSPVELVAPALATYGDLAVDADNIYWMAFAGEQVEVDPHYEIRATPKLGGVSRALDVFHRSWVGPALDDANLYIARADGVWRVTKDGTDAVQLTPVALRPLSIATDGTDVFVVERERIVSIPVSGGELVTIACTRAAHRIVVDENNVYWNEEDTNTIHMLPK